MSLSQWMPGLNARAIQKRFYQAWALTEVALSPAHWVYLLESRSSWLNNTALGVASGALDPKLLLTGLRVDEWTPRKVGLAFSPIKLGPLRKNEVSLSELTSATELALRIYWNRYLLSESTGFRICSMQWSGQSRLLRPLKVRYGHEEIERDQILFELGAEGSKKLNTSAIILNEAGLRLGSFEFELEFLGPLGLSSSSI